MSRLGWRLIRSWLWRFPSSSFSVLWRCIVSLRSLLPSIMSGSYGIWRFGSHCEGYAQVLGINGFTLIQFRIVKEIWNSLCCSEDLTLLAYHTFRLPILYLSSSQNNTFHTSGLFPDVTRMKSCASRCWILDAESITGVPLFPLLGGGCGVGAVYVLWGLDLAD